MKFEFLEQYIDGEIVYSNEYKGNLPKNFKFKKPIENKKKFDSVFHIYSGYYHQNNVQFTEVVDDFEKTQMKRLFVDLHFKNLFYEIFNFANETKVNVRMLIAIFYIFGTLLVGITMVENILFVINQFVT